MTPKQKKPKQQEEEVSLVWYRLWNWELGMGEFGNWEVRSWELGTWELGIGECSFRCPGSGAYLSSCAAVAAAKPADCSLGSLGQSVLQKVLVWTVAQYAASTLGAQRSGASPATLTQCRPQHFSYCRKYFSYRHGRQP